MTLITDRTAKDVKDGTAKGVYSAADLNRVESAVDELLPLLRGLGHEIDLYTKTDWSFQEVFSANWPVKTQMNRYLGNVKTLCELMNISHPDLPNIMDFLNWKSANAIERALEMISEATQAITSTYKYSGEFYAGEE